MSDFHTSVINRLGKRKAMEKDLFISVALLSDYRSSVRGELLCTPRDSNENTSSKTNIKFS